jgi:hypothetical protein
MTIVPSLFFRSRFAGICAISISFALVGVTADRAAAPSNAAKPIEWVRAGVNTNGPIWGVRGHLLFAIHPGGFSGGEGGPRGLIRLGYPTLPDGAYDLINFIAVEPIVRGKKGYSELEQSALDRRRGKRFSINPPTASPTAPAFDCGKLTSTNGIDQLQLTVFIERFDNGAHVRLLLTQRSDAPDELRLAIELESDSAPIDYCILTATMGNKARTRILWLKEGPVTSGKLFPDYSGSGFAPHRIFPVDRLLRNMDHDVVVAVTTDEERPFEIQPFGKPHFWDYRGEKVTQFWKMPAAFIRDDLQCAVNCRFTYWGSERPIPGGIAFENFELRQKFRSGDHFVFGITRRLPSEIVPDLPRK